MRTIADIRHARLEWVLREHDLTLADLSRRLGRSSRDSTLSQIRKRSPDSRTGKPRAMGSRQTRDIETALHLPVGIMDTDLPVHDLTVHGTMEAAPTPAAPAAPAAASASIDGALQVLGNALARVPGPQREAAATALAVVRIVHSVTLARPAALRYDHSEAPRTGARRDGWTSTSSTCS